MEAYLEAKWKLFSLLLTPTAFALFNDTLKSVLSNRTLPTNSYWYGTNSVESNGYGIELLQRSLNGARVDLRDIADEAFKADIPLLGDHLVENFCASAIIVARCLGLRLREVISKNVPGVPGRGELVEIENSKPLPLVVVDYAHTPDGLEKALTSVRTYASGKISIVFGCGGDRDPGKRSEMGEIAWRLSDAVFVTSDNPRREDPLQILNDISKGISDDSKPVFFEVDRRKAISMAIRSANPGDLVLIAGKGHEDFQIIGDKKLPFDDRKVAQAILREVAN